MRESFTNTKELIDMKIDITNNVSSNRVSLMNEKEVAAKFDYWYKPYLYFRSVWDKYEQKRTGLGDNEGVIPQLKNNFPKNKHAQWYKPLGDFKDFKNPEDMTREDIYLSWVQKFNEYQEASDGRMKTFKEIAINVSYNLQKRVLGKNLYSEFDLAKGISYMLWRSAEGTKLEIDVLVELQKRFNNEHRRFVAAPSYYETYDVDAIMVNNKGEHLMYVSIKNLGAFSEKTIDNYRNIQGKRNPMIYVGYNKQNELGFLYPDEWDKYSLRKHLNSGKTITIDKTKKYK